MNLVYDRTPLIVVDDGKGNTYKLNATSYCEYGDEIIVETYLRDTDLERGWVGNLTYRYQHGINPDTAKCMENTDYEKTYYDVLLRRVEIESSGLSEVTSWKYIFLND
jgi:hypothetical protein